jgi:hypothetical protein
MQDVTWMMVSENAERNASAQPKLKFPSAGDAAMRAWFESKGGVLTNVEYGVAADPSPLQNFRASARNRRGLVASEPIELNETIGVVPLKLTMCALSARNVKTKGGYCVIVQLLECLSKDQGAGTVL